jgi:hypothetical protein
VNLHGNAVHAPASISVAKRYVSKPAGSKSQLEAVHDTTTHAEQLGLHLSLLIVSQLTADS